MTGFPRAFYIFFILLSSIYSSAIGEVGNPARKQHKRLPKVLGDLVFCQVFNLVLEPVNSFQRLVMFLLSFDLFGYDEEQVVGHLIRVSKLEELRPAISVYDYLPRYKMRSNVTFTSFHIAQLLNSWYSFVISLLRSHVH